MNQSENRTTTQELEKLEELQERVDALTTERDQLAEALESRIVIEQAKGVLAERLPPDDDDAFLLLRRSARTRRVKIHRLAQEIASTRETPQADSLPMTQITIGQTLIDVFAS